MTSNFRIIFVLIFTFFVICSSVVLATDTNLVDLNSNVENSSSNLDTINNTDISSDTTLVNSQALYLDDLPESDLGLSNILSIILIAIGLVLILLGIAIIIKLK